MRFSSLFSLTYLLVLMQRMYSFKMLKCCQTSWNVKIRFHHYIFYFKAEEIIRVEVTKKLREVHFSRSLEEVSVTQSELQICLAVLAVAICHIKGSLTKSELSRVWFSLLKSTEIRGGWFFLY